jgi:gamma-glutamyl phosphate reductase
MPNLGPAAKKLTAPVTGRMDRYLRAVVDEVHAAKDDVLSALAESDASAAERHFALSTRLTLLETQIRELTEKNNH